MPQTRDPHRPHAISRGGSYGESWAGLARVFALVLVGLTGLAGSGCGKDPAILIKITADALVEQYDLYIRDDASETVIFHSGFNPVLAPGEKSEDGSNTRDLTKNALKIAIKLSKSGKYTLLIVGVAGALEGGKPGAGATQFFWAQHADIDGANEIDARLLTVPPGDDKDGDFWPDVTDFPAHVPEAATLYAGHMDLLDCDDKMDNPIGPTGMALMIRAENINPFATELCGDGFDENCNGNGDDPCVDADGDGDPKGSDCDDNDPARHKPNAKDPFPDPPNCCGYSLGMAGMADEHKNFTGDPLFCPTKRCGDGIDEGCRGNSVNNPANDTACVVDADCDGYPAAPQGDDCDDNDPNVHPGALEICGNGKNESCSKDGNGVLVADAGCVPCDLDGDGYQRNDAAANCPDATNQHPGLADCNDNDAGVYPGSSSLAGNKEGGVSSQGRIATAVKGLCRRIYEPTGVTGTGKVGTSGYTVGDADCNGAAYEGCPPPSCDVDGDGWPVNDCGIGLMGPFDCNDNDPTIFPGAPDHCGDGVDGNCSGADTPCAGMDKDGDGYLPPADCDDSNPNVHPFALELCNGIDDDCDGDKDDGNPDPMGAPLVGSGATATCTDDNDGECGKTLGRCVCSPTVPVVAQDADPAKRLKCSGWDSASARIPHCFGAGQPHKQTCGDMLTIDDDCDGRTDDPFGTNLATKGMPCGSNVGICKPGVVIGCVVTPSKLFYGASIPPGKSHWECSLDAVPALMSETCNGFDDDCDGNVPANEIDSDMDKFISCSGCSAGTVFAGNLLGCNDCDPAAGTTYPGAPELCDNVDNNCAAGITDDGVNDPLCTGKTCCSSQATCRNLTAGDANNCGMCGKSCSVRMQPGAGQPADNCAGGGCVCGGTGSACAAGQWCNGGVCKDCKAPDNNHCGANCTPCTAPNICKTDGSGCTGCNIDTDCDATHAAGTFYCVGGTCTAKKAPGTGPCTPPSGDPNGLDNECLGNAYCTDNVCCDKPPSMCGGCSACSRAGSLGTCSNVQPADSNPDPHNTCNANLAMCTIATCNGAGSCAAANGAACSAVGCVDNVAESHTQEQQCNNGTCGASQVMLASCGEYKCSGAACRTTCSMGSQCVKGHCWTGTGSTNQCYPLKVSGESCVNDNECNSGSCIGPAGAGVCCGTVGKPASCSTGLPPPSTSCATNQRTQYTCGGSNFDSCTTVTAACANSFKCQDATTCYAACTCSGGAPCSNPPATPPGNDTTAQCIAGTRCAAMNDTQCLACNLDTACTSACVDCTATVVCAAGMLTPNKCNGGGTACIAGTSAACPGDFACQNGTSCRNKCSDDTNCRAGFWCKGTAPNGTCQPRIASGTNCDSVNDTTCAGAIGGTTCNQCVMGGTPKTCGAGPKCP